MHGNYSLKKSKRPRKGTFDMSINKDLSQDFSPFKLQRIQNIQQHPNSNEDPGQDRAEDLG